MNKRFKKKGKARLTSLVELEYLEKKKRLLHKQAKRLLKKNKRLRKNYAITDENIIVKTQQASNETSGLESEHKTVEKLVVQPIEINSGGRNNVFGL